MFYAALRRTVADRRLAAARALGFGLVIGIGLIAKWSFLLVVLSLGVGLAFIPDTRRIYTDPRSVSRLTQTQPRRWRWTGGSP